MKAIIRKNNEENLIITGRNLTFHYTVLLCQLIVVISNMYVSSTTISCETDYDADNQPTGVVVGNNANGAGRPRFDSRAGQIGRSVANGSLT